MSRIMGAGAVALIAVFWMTPVDAAESFRMDDRAFSNRAAGLALKGDFTGAQRAARRIGRPDRRDEAYARVAVILSRIGKEKAGLVALARIGNAGRRDDTMVGMGVILARRGKLIEADKLASHLDPWRRDRIQAAMAMTEAEEGRIRKGWRMARKSRDLPRRRAAMIAFRSGLAKSLTTDAAIGAALGAKTLDDKIRSLLAVADRMGATGNAPGALRALTWARQMAARPQAGEALRDQVSADTAMVLLRIGDTEGARIAAASVRESGLRRFLVRHVEETAIRGG